MALYNSTFSDTPALQSKDPGTLIVVSALNNSAAAMALNLHVTDAAEVSFPRVTDDVAAAWTPEGQEITPDDLDTDEVSVAVRKLAALTKISVEAAKDRRAEGTVELVRESMGRDLGRKLDAAVFGTTTLNGPNGLRSYTGLHAVDAGAAWANLDPFEEAIAHAEARGTRVRAFVVNPTDALALATLKQGSGSNVPLLQSDPASPSGKAVRGVPLLVTSAQAVNVIDAITEGAAYLVLRTANAGGSVGEFEVDGSAGFTSYSVFARGILRAGLGVVDEAAMSRLTITPV